MSLGLERGGESGERLLVEHLARLPRVGLDRLHRKLDESGALGSGHQIGFRLQLTPRQHLAMGLLVVLMNVIDNVWLAAPFLMVLGGLWICLFHTRLRLAGLALVAAGAGIAPLRDRPDVLVGRDGAPLGMLTQAASGFTVRGTMVPGFGMRMSAMPMVMSAQMIGRDRGFGFGLLVLEPMTGGQA